MVSPVDFLSVLSQHGRLRMVSLKIASRDAQTLNLSRNVSKFYAWQVVSLMNEQQSQNYLLLEVDPPFIIRKNKSDHARWNTHSKLQPSWEFLDFLYRIKRKPHFLLIEYIVAAFWIFVSRISPPLEHSATYSFCFVAYVRWTACVLRKFEGLNLIKNHRNNLIV